MFCEGVDELMQEGSGSAAVSGGSSGSASITASRSVNPFISNPHGHPSFNPVKLGTKGTVSIDSSSHVSHCVEMSIVIPFDHRWLL